MSTPGPSANGTHRQSNDNLKGSRFSRIAAVFVVMVMAASCLVLVNGSDDSYAETWVIDEVTYSLLKDNTELYISNSGSSETRDYTVGSLPPWYAYRESISYVNVSNGMTYLGNYLLYGLTKLETIEFGNGSGTPSLTTIGTHCFSGDTSLTTVALPSNVTSIGASAFEGCSSLASISIPSNLSTIGLTAFMDSGLTEITLPSGVTTIPGTCFMNCKNLVTVNISSGTTTIGVNAFKDCKVLANISMPDTITAIQSSAFYNCKNIQDIRISGGLTSVSSSSFDDVTFYDADLAEMDKSVASNLRGKTFYRMGDMHVEIADPLVHDGSDCSITQDLTTSVEVHTSSIAYVVNKANSDASTTFRVNLKDGLSASFDSTAIKTLSAATATLHMDTVHPESIDEKTKELVGDNPVYNISFGDNTDFGDGRMTITLPYTLPEGESADRLKVYCIADGEIAEKYDCTYADGLVTFSTGHLSTYSFGFESSSGGKFPVWAIVLIVLVVLAAAGGAATFFIIKNKKDGSPSGASGPAAPVVNDASGSSSGETKETTAEEPPAPAAEPVEETVPREEEQPAPAEEKAEPVAEEPVAEAPAKEEVPAPVAEPAVEEAPAVPVAEAQPEPEGKAPIEAPAPAEEPVAEAPAEDVPAPEINKESEPAPEKEEPAPATEEKPRKKRPVSNMDDDDLDPSGSEDW